VSSIQDLSFEISANNGITNTMSTVCNL